MEQIFETISGIALQLAQVGLNWVLIGLIVTTAVSLLLMARMFGRLPSRYLIWMATLAILLVAPLLIKIPGAPVSMNEAPVASASGYTRPTPMEIPKEPMIVPEGAKRHEVYSVPAKTQTSPDPVVIHKAANKEVAIAPLLLTVTPLVLMWLWMTISLLLICRTAIGWLKLRQIKERAVDLDWQVQSLAHKLSRQIGLTRLVRIAYSDEIPSPTAAGLTNPTILIPNHLKQDLSENEMEMILLHELVHLKRRDDWMRLFQSVVTSITFFNPAIHWINRQLEIEREISCDDRVVSIIGQRSGYARCLARLTTLCGEHPRPALTQNAVWSKKQIYRRFEMLFSRNKDRSKMRKTKLAIVTTLAIAISVFALQVVPAVAFPGNTMSYSELSSSIDDLIESLNPPEESTATDEASLTDEASAADNADLTEDADISDVSVENGVPEESYEIETADAVSTTDASVEAHAYAGCPEANGISSSGDDSEASDHSMEHESQSPCVPASDVQLASADLFGISGTGLSTEIDDDGESRVSWSDGRHRVRVRMYGEIEFTPEEDGIKSISRDAYFEVYEKRGSGKRELEVEAGDDGQPVFKYWEDGDKTDFEPNGRKWLKSILPDIFRNTGLDAENRVTRIYKTSGVDGVLDEMELIRSDYVVRIYFENLVEIGKLDKDDLERVLKLAADRMDSDYEKAELAIAIADYGIDENGLVTPYVNLVKTLDSDYETRRVLSELGMQEPMEKETLVDILDIAARMDSDYEKAELLISMAHLSRSDEELRDAYVEAVANMESDYEIRRVLEELGTNYATDGEFIRALLQIADRMDSDYEKAELLIELADQARDDDDLYMTYIAAAATLESDYEAKRVLTKIGSEHIENREVARRVLEVVARLESDYEKSEIMLEFEDAIARNPDLIPSVVDVLGSMGSDYEKARVIQNVIGDADLPDEVLVTLIGEIARMTGDYEKSELLQGIGRRCRGNDILEDAFLDAVETIASEYEQDRAYASLHKKRRSGSY